MCHLRLHAAEPSSNDFICRTKAAGRLVKRPAMAQDEDNTVWPTQAHEYGFPAKTALNSTRSWSCIVACKYFGVRKPDLTFVRFGDICLAAAWCERKQSFIL